MGERTGIEWTDATWTPIRARVFEPQNDGGGKERVGWHCEHVSEGCRNCYAERINLRLGTGLDFKPGERFREDRIGYVNGSSKIFLDETMLRQPLRWRRPRMIFVCSMTDLFAEFVEDAWIDQMFTAMALAPQHIFQVLTKRPARMLDYFTRIRAEARLPGEDLYSPPRRMDAIACELTGSPCAGGFMEDQHWPLKNVWLGISAEDQATFDSRWPCLRETPAAVRFISYEPALGPLSLGTAKPDWLIAGGESGPNARAMHPQWARSIRDQCAGAGIPFLFKQWGEWAPSAPDEAVTPRSGWLPLRGQLGGIAKKAELYPEAGAAFVARVGKKSASRRLDGIEHNAFPEVS